MSRTSIRDHYPSKPIGILTPKTICIHKDVFSRVVDMLDVVKRNVGPLCQGFADRNANGYIDQVLVRVWKCGKLQRLVERSDRSVCETDGGNLLALSVKAGDGEGTALSKPGGGTCVGT